MRQEFAESVHRAFTTIPLFSL